MKKKGREKKNTIFNTLSLSLDYNSRGIEGEMNHKLVTNKLNPEGKKKELGHNHQAPN
jgi:hypothetical protein